MKRFHVTDAGHNRVHTIHQAVYMGTAKVDTAISTQLAGGGDIAQQVHSLDSKMV